MTPILAPLINVAPTVFARERRCAAQRKSAVTARAANVAPVPIATMA
jgi:hypothetical protein